MPRDDNGVYSLPSGNPVAPGTTIEDAWANSTLNDVAAALTDSLSRTGQGGMQYPLTFGDGTVSAPGIAWTNETGSGLYRAGAADTRLTLQGYGDTARWYNRVFYVRNVANSAWAPVVYQGGVGSVPVGTTNLDTLVWSTETSSWVRQAKNAGGVLPVGSSTLTALQWNDSTQVWTAVVPSISGASVAVGTVESQTLRWDNSALQWKPSSNLTVSAAGIVKGVWNTNGTANASSQCMVLTAAQYAAIVSKDANTLYFVTA